MIVKASLTKKLPGVEYCNDSFPAVLRGNGNLHVTLLDEKDRVCDLALLEAGLIFSIICGGPSIPDPRE